MPSREHDRPLRGVTFSRQFPNPAEPSRGTFVAEQVEATSSAVDWRVIAPLAWPQRSRSAVVPRRQMVSGRVVERPRYFVLPRRMLFDRVARSMSNGSAAAFARAMAEHDPDFVHAHELYPSGVAAAELCASAGIPLVVSVHGSDLYTNLGRPAWCRQLEIALRGASAVVAVSSALAEDLLAEFPAMASKTRVIADTYDASRFSLVRRPSHEGPLRLLSVGRLAAEKGFDVLIAAMGVVRAQGVDCRLRIVGDGAQAAVLHDAVRTAGLEDTVEFVGGLDRAALAEQYAWADLYVQPSRREGFGVAIVEALATGLPVVVTDSGGPRDIVTAKNGVIVAPDDPTALSDVIAHAAARLGEYDPARIAADALERFGPDSVGKRLVAVYDEVTKGELRG